MRSDQRRTRLQRSLAVAVMVFGAGIAFGWLMQSRSVFQADVLAQPMRTAGAGGIMAFPSQLGKDSYGMVMVDVDAGTLWVYQFQLKRQGHQLKLMAARSWMYDRYLEEYNCAPPTPSEVSQLVVGDQEQGGGEKEAKKMEPPAPGR